ncbi:unnamed protein product [Clonostachys rosea]|uniref:Uncharacterized protein n=1 Tax=Bionectria ochroleuca TaxID=29856 RepID=A0ABY6U5H5_BIOOC|nr:unnamed protein product [Clonostachys rosea]
MPFHLPGPVKAVIPDIKNSEVASVARPFENILCLDDDADQHHNGESEVDFKEVPSPFKSNEGPFKPKEFPSKSREIAFKSKEIPFKSPDITSQVATNGHKHEAVKQETETNVWRANGDVGDISHQIISSYFIGPQAENLDYFEANIHTILEELRNGRTNYYPQDGKFITSAIQNTPAFKKSMDKLSNAVKKAANLLSRTSIPFWSPRYEAHMCTDMSMASLLGYFMTMLYNPNNVALEASPLSTVAEIEVGEQLCTLFGYNINDESTEEPTGWGHVTCDGTIANLESINLKYYPLSLREAMKPGAPLEYISPKFFVETCAGQQKLFSDLTAWELLNLKSNDILDIPDRLYQEHEFPTNAHRLTEGAVDSLSSVLALRKQFQARGLSFLVHGDAAWGGYFCTMLPKNYQPGEVINLPTEMGDSDGFVPDASLRAETQEDLYALRFADSITVDPHKAGYIPYPAGGLCYRDGRMRFLVTWTSPYLSRGSVTSIGIYGVEGSKPGASAVSTWLSNKTIGLTQDGYGSLLGEVTWTCTRLAAEWAALTDTTSPFICVPFNELPSELEPNTTPEKVEAEKARIRRDILSKTNAEIVMEDASRPSDLKATKLLRDLGSDLNINAFSLNFRHADGCLNDDVEEANYLMQRVIEALSVDSPNDDPTKIPLYLTSTEFSDELYGNCKKNFMRRLGLKDSHQDLMVLRNVVMSPFPSDGNFLGKLAQTFRETVEKETQVVRKRNELGEDFHSFLIQGTEDPYLIHLPMFHVANHRQQLIVSVDFDNKSKDKYLSMRNSNLTEPMILVTQRKTFLQDIIRDNGTFTGQIKTKDSGIILKNIAVTVTNTVAPNTQLSASGCTLELDSDVPWSEPLVLLLNDIYEAPMQPFPSNSEIGTKNGAIISYKCAEHNEDDAAVVTSETRSGRARGSGFFFRPGATFRACVHLDGDRTRDSSRGASWDLGEKVGEGTITLGSSVYVDSEAMNWDPFKEVERINEWRYEFDQIGKELE